jgi:predicted RecA/RadA family phage recombinase
MAAETQMPGFRLHIESGEAYPYLNPFTSAQLVTPIPGLNVIPILPAGSVIVVSGLIYVTRKPLEAGRPGEMFPLGRHPSYIGPKKVGDSFVDRAAVYWDTVNNYFTSTNSGTTIFVGYAVANSQLGSATCGTGSTLVITPVSGANEYNAVATVTGATSMDGQVGSYAAADTAMEVEFVMATAVTNNTSFTGQATTVVADPGTGANIVVTAGGTCELTIAAPSETRGLPAPTYDGQRMELNIKHFTTSATCKVALGAVYNGTPSTTIDGTNKFATFNAFGQAVLLEAIPLTATTFQWMLVAKLGATLADS